MNTERLAGIRIAIEEDPKVKFQTLPQELQQRFHHSCLVHMHVSAFIYGKITREEMMEKLSIALLEQNVSVIKRLEQFCNWFGAPTEIIEKNEHP